LLSGKAAASPKTKMDPNNSFLGMAGCITGSAADATKSPIRLPSLYALLPITCKVVSNFKLSWPSSSCLRKWQFSVVEWNEFEFAFQQQPICAAHFDMDSVDVVHFLPPLESFKEDYRTS
jgi:hypothetical protein